MMFFELKDRMKRLPTMSKMWMYPAAYTLIGIANSVLWATNKFNVATYHRMKQV